MSITGQVGHVAFAKQSVFGTPVSNAASGAIKVTGDSLVSNNNPLVAEGEIGLGRDVSQSVPGGFSAAGAVNGNLRARAANILLEGALGTRVAGGGVDTYIPANNLPVWTVQKKVGASSPQLLVLQYQDAMVNTLNISAPSGALATFSAGLITAGESRLTGAEATGTGLVTPTYAATSDDLLVFHGGRIMTGAEGDVVTTQDETFQSIEVVVNNNVAADEYTVRPSRFLRSLTEGIRSVEANMTLVFENPDKYSQYTYGASTATGPGYAFYEGALQVFLGNFQNKDTTKDAAGSPETGTAFTGFTAATPSPAPASGVQIVQFNIPRLAFTGLPVALSTGRIVVTTTARALKSDTNGVDILTAYVRPHAA
jgi:Phage tail tube protein